MAGLYKEVQIARASSAQGPSAAWRPVFVFCFQRFQIFFCEVRASNESLKVENAQAYEVRMAWEHRKIRMLSCESGTLVRTA